jgi:hypothetical protein
VQDDAYVVPVDEEEMMGIPDHSGALLTSPAPIAMSFHCAGILAQRPAGRVWVKACLLRLSRSRRALKPHVLSSDSQSPPSARLACTNTRQFCQTRHSENCHTTTVDDDSHERV